jgi:hypothetical protein
MEDDLIVVDDLDPNAQDSAGPSKIADTHVAPGYYRPPTEGSNTTRSKAEHSLVF